MARLRVTLRGRGPGDRQKILKQDSWIHRNSFVVTGLVSVS